MTTYFADDFNRANGAVGNDWQVGASWSISSNCLRMTEDGFYTASHLKGATGDDARVTAWITADSSWIHGEPVAAFIRTVEGCGSGYQVEVDPGATATGTLKIKGKVSGSWTTLATDNARDYTAGLHSIAIEAVGTAIKAFWDGTEILSITDSMVSSGTHVGVSVNKGAGHTYWLDDFAETSVFTGSLSVAPASVPTDGVAIPMTVQGVGTTWTVGVPGSPTFTVDAGTITAQLVLSPGLAAFTYNAPASEQTITLTDPSTGATTTFEIADSAPWWMPGGGDIFGLYRALQILSDNLQDALNDAALALWDGEELDPGESILSWVRFLGTPPEGETLTSLLVTILDELQNDHDDPTTVRSVLVDILAELYTIDGFPSRTTLTDLANAIAEVSAPDLSEITEALEGLVTQLTTAQTSLNIIGDNDANSLGAVLLAIAGAVDDVGIVDAKADTLTDKVDAATVNGTINLGGLLAAEGGVAALATAGLIIGIIGLVRGTGATIIQTVDLIEDVVDDGTNLLAIGGHVLDFLADHAVPSPTALSTDVSGVLTAVNGVHDDLEDDVAALTDAINGLSADLGSQHDVLEAKLDSIIDALAALPSSSPPVWPGEDNVTLGEPVALDAGTQVDGPMDGVLLNITAMERLIPYLTMDTFKTYRNLGRFAFVNDSGYMEDWRGIPNLHALLTPLHMRQADKLYISCYTGVTGTATPYLVNVPE